MEEVDLGVLRQDKAEECCFMLPLNIASDLSTNRNLASSSHEGTRPTRSTAPSMKDLKDVLRSTRGLSLILREYI